MFIKGECLLGTVTLNFWIHGEKSNWTVKITGPHGLALEDQTVERAWFGLFSELLASASETVKRKRLSIEAGAAR